jgi:hypothetical protein
MEQLAHNPFGATVLSSLLLLDVVRIIVVVIVVDGLILCILVGRHDGSQPT